MPPAAKEAIHSDDFRARVLAELATMSGRMERIEERQELFNAQVVERCAHIEKKVEQTRDLLTGNGSPEKGLIVRVDRLEQSGDKRGKALWAMFVALLSTIGGVVVALFKDKV